MGEIKSGTGHGRWKSFSRISISSALHSQGSVVTSRSVEVVTLHDNWLQGRLQPSPKAPQLGRLLLLHLVGWCSWPCGLTNACWPPPFRVIPSGSVAVHGLRCWSAPPASGGAGFLFLVSSGDRPAVLWECWLARWLRSSACAWQPCLYLLTAVAVWSGWGQQILH